MAASVLIMKETRLGRVSSSIFAWFRVFIVYRCILVSVFVNVPEKAHAKYLYDQEQGQVLILFRISRRSATLEVLKRTKPLLC